MDCADLSKKRVWLGLRLPGRRMIALATTAKVRPLFNSRRILNECYQGPPWKGLLCAAICFNELAELEAAEAARVLKDVREFLALRYRAGGLEDVSLEELLDDLRNDSFPPNVVPRQPDIVINYLVAALDALSNAADVSEDDAAFAIAAQALRDLAERTGRLLAEQRYSKQDWREMAPLWDDAVAWRAAA